MRLAAYVRHSTDTQQHSEETQRTILADWAASNGHEIAAWYVDNALSASIPAARRPAASAMLDAALSKRRDWDGILLLHGDRLFRDDIEERVTHEQLQRHKCGLIALDGAMDRSTLERALASDILARIKMYERELTGIRIRERNMARALQGKVPSGYLPMGLRYDPTTKLIAPDDRAGDAVTLFRLFVECNGNATETAKRANRTGMRGTRGSLLSAHAVLIIIRSAYYRQQIRYAGRTVDAPDIPAIIPPALLAAADRLLTATAPLAPRARIASAVYSGLLVCDQCGRHLRRRASASKLLRFPHSEIQYGNWVCPGRIGGVCDTGSVSERLLDRLIGRALARLLAQHAHQPMARTAHQAHAASERQRQRLELKRSRWAELYAEGMIDLATLRREVAGIEATLATLATPTPAAPLTADDLARWTPNLAERWPEIPAADRRRLLLALGAEILVTSRRDVPRGIALLTALDADPVVESYQSRTRRHVRASRTF